MGLILSRIFEREAYTSLITAHNVANAIHELSEYHYALRIYSPKFIEDIWRMILFPQEWKYRFYAKNCHTLIDFEFLIDEIYASKITRYLKLVNSCACAVTIIRAGKLDKQSLIGVIWRRFEL